MLQEGLVFRVRAGFCQTFCYLVRSNCWGALSLLSKMSTDVLEVEECEERGLSLAQSLSASSEN